MYVFLGFITFLTLSLWLIAIWFATFAVRVLKRQDVLCHALVARLRALDTALGEAVEQSETIRASLANISIPVNEPIAKYEGVTLPDDATIRFVERS